MICLGDGKAEPLLLAPMLIGKIPVACLSLKVLQSGPDFTGRRGDKANRKEPSTVVLQLGASKLVKERWCTSACLTWYCAQAPFMPSCCKSAFKALRQVAAKVPRVSGCCRSGETALQKRCSDDEVLKKVAQKRCCKSAVQMMRCCKSAA